MPIDNLPKPGEGFRAGRFSRKLSGLTRAGSFKNLSDNKKGISQAVAKYATAIRRGGLSRKQQAAVMGKIKAAEGSNLTRGDKKDARKILKHLGRNRVAIQKTNSRSVSEPQVSALEKKKLSKLSAEDIKKRNVASSRRSSDFLNAVKKTPGYQKTDNELKHDSMAGASALNPGSASAPKTPPSKPSSGSFSNLY